MKMGVPEKNRFPKKQRMPELSSENMITTDPSVWGKYTDFDPVYLQDHGADLDSDKEAADMGCDHKNFQLNRIGKINDITAHSSTTTDKMIKDLLFQIK
ncbi:hypothetical protein AVEN_46851-1 [Araneus ventricosus]|uniref:Uncharacterized protein n=1 Tax=Araneus ventricosus TaxID=182803 RepID=A0A4Y2CLL7_ARAVE|nr:hypothetical protein AVEN_46851-1 [Araneus ventricosus]